MFKVQTFYVQNYKNAMIKGMNILYSKVQTFDVQKYNYYW